MSRKLTLILPALGAVALMGGLAVTTLQAQTPAQTPTQAAAPVPPAVAAKGHPHKDPVARFAARDTNKDGFIDKSEATGALIQRFDEIDTNHDGKISLDEMQAAWKDRMTVAHRIKHGPKGEHPLMGGGAHLAQLDTNKDGKVSWDEMSAATKAHFDQLDTNHDGFIDASEMPKGPKIGHKPHKHGRDDMPPPAADTPAPAK